MRLWKATNAKVSGIVGFKIKNTSSHNKHTSVHRWFCVCVGLVIAYRALVFTRISWDSRPGGELSNTTETYKNRRRQGRGLIDVDVNVARENELILLPTIGPVLAKRIIEYRNQHGDFQDLSELEKVRGVGPKTIEKIKVIAIVGDTIHRLSERQSSK